MCEQLQLRMTFGGLIYLCRAPRADYEMQPGLNKAPFYTANEFHQSTRAEKQGKKPTIQCHSIYLALNCSSEKPPQSREDIHYSRKPPSQQNRRAGPNERVAIQWL